jgi:hypothetical protein
VVDHDGVPCRQFAGSKCREEGQRVTYS